jgi:transmembrane sensor
MEEPKKSYIIPDEILNLLTLQALGTISGEEAKALNRWLSEHPQAEAQCHIFTDKIKKLNWTYQSNNIEIPHQFIEDSLAGRASQRPRYLRNYNLLAYAATFIILAGFIWYFVWERKTKSPEIALETPALERQNRAILVLSDGTNLDLENSPGDSLTNESGVRITNRPGEILRYEKQAATPEDTRMNRLIIPAGARYQLQLLDGTKVWMNAGSELEYPVSFPADQRAVRLKGEAFFDVARNENAPFLVEANGYEIRVLGTSLNISAYDSDDFIQTTLVSGKLEVNNRRGQVHKLKPGQMAMIHHSDQEVSINEVDTRLYTSWREGILHFNKITLRELAKKLERWYDVEIIFENEQIAGLTFSGAMENSRDIRFLLKLIGQAANVNFEIEENRIYVK